MGGASVPLRGSEDKLREGERWLSEVDPGTRITLTILVRRPASAPSGEALLSGLYHAPADRAAAERALEASPADMAAVQSWAKGAGFTVLKADAGSRRVQVSGTVAQVDAALGVQLKWAQGSGGSQFMSYEGNLSMPKQLSDVITAVLGLSTRAAAQPRS